MTWWMIDFAVAVLDGVLAAQASFQRRRAISTPERPLFADDEYLTAMYTGRW